ncbi:magnesium and cobalt transport protein CorA [Kineococcus rubinsiae]|uniref:magnesium and cobalt transport protein CorA n=1 Tax=Kineococcus rubinsiae TaxID=2609562 RepID=UPI00143184B4|nr:magnesium and cobalt transport protein CorA [Kineococcus rubinsiae]NIZ89731.1 magnesium and cobalt transport protein CorA [Kineococcus rubinsiae]
MTARPLSLRRRAGAPPAAAPPPVPAEAEAEAEADHAAPRGRGDGLAMLPVVDCKLYDAQGGHCRVDDLDGALATARTDGGFVWIGLHGTSARDLERLAGFFQLPALAVEDAINAHQRPKFEQYPGMTFAVLKPVRYVDHDEVVDVSEIAIFLGEHFLITVRHGESTVVAGVRAEVDSDAQHAPTGPGSVLYRLLDHVVDGYTEAVDEIAIDIEEIEAAVFSGGEDDHAERIYKLKREVLTFKRSVGPLVGPLQRLVEGDPGSTASATIAAEKRPYYRDVLDHLLRAVDAIDGYDRLLTDVLQAHLTQVSVRQNRVAARQNEDMRKISAWAAIALVPTAIAGIYGMNFQNMPELSTRYGYFVVLGVILSVCVSLYAVFRAKDWL